MNGQAIIRNKLIEAGGKAIIYSLQGKEFTIEISEDGKGFKTKKLPPPDKYHYGFDVFDIIIDLLRENNGKAFKGNGRNHKLGQPKCTSDTVVGAVAYRYMGKKEGESIFDPVFVLAAILDWAELCYNKRGYIELR